MDPTFIDDPAQNFGLPEQVPTGISIPEFAIRQVISYGLAQIRKNIRTPLDVVDKLFASVSPTVRSSLKDWLLKHENIYLDVAWPSEGESLPMIVVEPQDENEGEPLLGDLAGTTDYNGDSAKLSSLAYVIPESHKTQIYIGTQDDRLTLFLYALVKFILLVNKDALTQYYDVNAMSLSGQVLEKDAQKLPTMAYFRVLQMSYTSLFSFNGLEAAAKIVSVELAVQAEVDGELVEVTVPSDP